MVSLTRQSSNERTNLLDWTEVGEKFLRIGRLRFESWCREWDGSKARGAGRPTAGGCMGQSRIMGQGEEDRRPFYSKRLARCR